MATTTTTPLSSPTRKSTNHPHGVKSTSSGILARSNTTGQTQPTQSKHHYHPSPYSPSTSTIRSNDEQTQIKLPTTLNKSPKSEKSNDSASLSKYSNTWLARNSQGEPVTLPRHPYSWNPQQLALYLAADLHADDGTPLDSETVQAIVGFVQDCKISGRVFLTLDEEDFQEMHGLDPSQCNAMRDAASILRKHALPYKPGRVLSTAIKRGKVRSIVDVFEKSASETSDTGEDDPEDLPKVSSWKHTIGGKSKLDDETSKTRASSQNTVHEPMIAPGTDPDSGEKTQFDLSDGSAEQALHAAESEKTERSSVSFLEQEIDQQEVSFPEPQLVPVLPPQPSTPTDIFITDKVAYHPGPTTEQINSPFPVFREPEDVPDEDTITPHNTTREVDIASIPAQREENEPSMAELYTQTYGELPPTSSRTIPVEMKYVEEPIDHPSWPPTALRPVRGKDKIPGTSHGVLQDLFEPVEQSGPPEISGDSASTEPQTDREKEALLAVEVLKARLVEVENRLEAMERAEVIRGATDPDPDLNTLGEQWQHRRRHYSLSSDDFSEGEAEYFTNPPPSTGLRALRDILVGSATDLGGTRSWQNTAIILAGATTAAVHSGNIATNRFDTNTSDKTRQQQQQQQQQANWDT